jgi:NTP pyrophosphatase (non-canonical NTP hydrolase)
MKKAIAIGKIQKLDDYQTAALKYDTFVGYQDGLMKYSRDGVMFATETGLIEKVMGLPGEAGETIDKFKKIIRDKNGMISLSDKEEIKKELGDVLWYVTMIAEYLEIPLSEVANANLEKLESRYVRNKLHGSGDNR